MSVDRLPNPWLEVFFTTAFLATGIAFMVASALIPIAQDERFSSRTLPMAMAAAIAAFGAIKLLVLLRGARGHSIAAIESDGTVLRIIVPLSAAMVLYVPLVLAVGYLFSTALIMMMVLWIFGVRGLLLIPLLACATAAISDLAFVRLLGMFMPEGWLIEWVQEAIWSR